MRVGYDWAAEQQKQKFKKAGDKKIVKEIMTEMCSNLMKLTDRRSSMFPKQTWRKQYKTYHKWLETRDEEKTLQAIG